MQAARLRQACSFYLMGSKLHKPVVTYEEVEKELGASGAAMTEFQQMFSGLSRGAGEDAVVSKDAFIQLIGRHAGAVADEVLQRVFTVLDTNGSGTIDYREFVSALYVFRRGSRTHKLKVLFNAFDISGSGLINRKDFAVMAQALIVGGRAPSWDRRALGVDEPGMRASEITVGFEFFKPLVDMMVEMAMLEFDRDGDGKLSFDEWKQYAEDDPMLLQLVDNLARIGQPVAAAAAASSSASGAAATVTAASRR